MNIKFLLFFEVLFFLSCVGSAFAKDNDQQDIIQTAVLKRVNVPDSKYLYTYFIQVVFSVYRDSSTLLPDQYRIYSTDQPINLVHPEIVTAAEYNDSGKFKRINLFREYKKGKRYRLEYSHGTASPITVDVLNDSTIIDSTTSMLSIARWLSQNTYIDLDVRQLVHTDNAVAIDYQLELNMWRLNFLNTGSSVSRMSFLSSGQLGSDSNKTPNTLNGAFVLTWLDHTEVGSSEHLFYGFRIPVGFEGPQSFRKDGMQYTVKFQGACSLPFVSDVFLWWHRAIDYQENFLPPVVFIGYTYAIGTGGSSNSRLDGELVFHAPLGTGISISVTGNASYVDKNLKKSISVSSNLTVSKAAKFIVKYSAGALAPIFKEFENWGLGLGLTL